MPERIDPGPGLTWTDESTAYDHDWWRDYVNSLRPPMPVPVYPPPIGTVTSTGWSPEPPRASDLPIDPYVRQFNWTLEDALQLIRVLQREVRRFHFHVTLGGGVLNNGSSQKDLDLWFLPMDNGTLPARQELLDWLTSLWGTSEDLWKDYSHIGGFVTQKSIYKRKFMRGGTERIDVWIY